MAARSCGPITAFRARPARPSATIYQFRRPNSSSARAITRAIDSYSAFYENDRVTHTGLTGYLRERGFTRVFLAGLAFDFCVRYSAEDARHDGFEAVVIEDACRGIDVAGSMAATRAVFKTIGVTCVNADAITR